MKKSIITYNQVENKNKLQEEINSSKNEEIYSYNQNSFRTYDTPLILAFRPHSAECYYD